MAHYYVADEIQQLADYVGDSYYLSETATKVTADTIVLCGVSFMGESAKILNPEKRVLLPDMTADCPMLTWPMLIRYRPSGKSMTMWLSSVM